jgi:peptide deformylase
MIEIVTNKEELLDPCSKLANEEIISQHGEMKKALVWIKNPENNAIGLAAPQIGYKEAWFVMKFPGATWTEPNYLIVINPKVLSMDGKAKEKSEGCLSAPGELYSVWRRPKLKARYLTINDNGKISKEIRTFTGKSAQIFQHEMDHLKGKPIFWKGQKIIDENEPQEEVNNDTSSSNFNKMKPDTGSISS